MKSDLYWTGIDISLGALAFLGIVAFTIVAILGQMVLATLLVQRDRKKTAAERRRIEAKGAQEGRKEREEYERIHHDEQARLTVGRAHTAASD